MGIKWNTSLLDWLFDHFCPCLTHKNMREDELTTQDIKDIKQSLKDFEDGKFYTTDELKRKLGL